MPYQVDLWSGELHQHHYASLDFATWAEVSVALQEALEVGMLANVMHSDFAVPASRQPERDALMIKMIQQKGT